MLKKISNFAWRLIVDEDGPTAVEYAVMLMLIFLACIAMIQVVGQSTSTSFTNSNDAIETAIQDSQS